MNQLRIGGAYLLFRHCFTFAANKFWRLPFYLPRKRKVNGLVGRLVSQRPLDHPLCEALITRSFRTSDHGSRDRVTSLIAALVRLLTTTAYIIDFTVNVFSV